MTFYNPKFGDDHQCACGHAYERHFDSYAGMEPVGCKYCACSEWHTVGLEDALLCIIYYAALTARKQVRHLATTKAHSWTRDLRGLRDDLVLRGCAP